MFRIVVSILTLPVFLGALALVAGDAPAEKNVVEDAAWNSLIKRFEAAVRTHYPKAVTTRAGARIHVEHDARDYQVHHLGKGGEWQDAVRERGPRRKGMVLDVRMVRGPYRSQLGTGEFDERTYVEHRMVRVDREHRRHVHARLRLPTGVRRLVPDGFVQDLTSALEGFGTDLRAARR